MIARIRGLAAVACLIGLAAGSSSCARREPPPNIVLVVLDTLRRDFTGAGAAANASETPNLDRLSVDSTVFSNAWANAPWTVPSHASLFTGLLPVDHGCDSRRLQFQSPAPTMAERLARSGYDTAAFFSNPWLSDRMTGLTRGFAVRQLCGTNGWSALLTNRHGGDDILRSVDGWLSSRGKRPFFLFVNFVEAHLPFNPPKDFRQQLPADWPPDRQVSVDWAQEFNARTIPPDAADWPAVRELYGADVRWADANLGALITLIEARGWRSNTVIIVVSDHGENLGEHNLMDHQFCIYETLLAVPLVIHAPTRMSPGVRPEPVMVSDLYATVLDLAGLDLAEAPVNSVPLTRGPLAPDRPLVAEYAGAPANLIKALRALNPKVDGGALQRSFATVRRGSLRLTVADDGTTELHDLAVDPGQKENRAANHPAEVSALRALLPANALDWPRNGESPSAIDPALREQLRSLGYVR